MNYRERYPDWFRELVRAFDLVLCDADKFVSGMSAIGRRLSRSETNRPFANLPLE